MLTMTYGQIFAQMGYNHQVPNYEMNPDEILEMFGLKK
jgi:hypothetical protein